MIPPFIIRWLAAIPELIRIGRKSHRALTEPDEEKVNENAWSYHTIEHVRGQVDSATSFKVKSPDGPKTAQENQAKKALDSNPYIDSSHIDNTRINSSNDIDNDEPTKRDINDG